ncbi:MAG: hypothetical protein HY647_03230 [Acidobacteria bacterium]|nr:hypothetical protein [Acidobacteriota bacterium]
MLDAIGEHVIVFAQRFSSVTCTEQISQSKLDDHGKVVIKQQSAHDYMISLQLTESDLTIEESRTLQGEAERKSTEALLTSKGFSAMILIFHPYFQSSYEFFLLPDSVFQGRRLHRIQFQQIAGSRTPSVLQLGGIVYPLEWKGEAWIDPESWRIVMIETSLANPLDHLGLKRLDSEVLYALIPQGELEDAYWLPQEALVEAQTPRQHWRNVHRFTNYKRFTVETKITTQTPE